ncbi:GyrI-like domain-containing protein [Janibacter melonis]|uniref:GyrI-like domain-containing protein n=1 Tax=Janibacter melonis TaxID=262209 RepID=UPI00174D2EC5|nr:GyrI-like domain-containing protein [Janibacter melonis]
MTAMVIEERAEQAWVGMHTTADLAHWDRVNAHVPRIYAALAGADQPPLGGPIYRYRRMQTAADPMDVTVSVPVAQRVELDGFASGVLPAGRYLVARPEGGPDALTHIHGEMWRWAEAQGLELAVEERPDGIHWAVRTEQFLTDPETQPDRSCWVVEVAYLLR